jgi:PadR family transcriptional regulator, regulatory protein PadR
MIKDSEDKTTQSWLKEAQKGYIRMGVLILLNKKPAHGYEIMKEINNRTKGFWQPTPGGVYPILRDLEKSGYIRGKWETQKGRNLKVYKITQSGQAILKKAIVKQSEIFKNINNLFTEFARDVLNVQSATSPLPMPEMFEPFLKDKTSCQTLEALEHERDHVREAIKMGQEKLKLIDKQILEIKKENKKPPETAPP